MCYSHRDHEARQAGEEARRRAQREQGNRRRREGTAGGSERPTPEKERKLIRA